MEKIWFVVIEGKRFGPYSFEQLKGMSFVTPDTLVWREGFAAPLPARDVPELRALFEDDEPLNPQPEEPSFVKGALSTGQPAGELILDRQPPAPMLFLWLLLIASIFMFIILRLADGY